MPSKNIVILGAAGFLGRQLCKYLENDQQDSVTLLLNNTFPNISQQFRAIWIKDFLCMEPQPCDIFVNLATAYRDNRTTEQIFNVNVEAPIKILQNLQLHKNSVIIQADTFFSKFKVKRDLCSYTKSKVALRQRLNQEFGDLRRVIASIEHMYGPGDALHKFVPMVLRKLLANEQLDLTHCQQFRDFIYVDDVARAITRLIDHVFPYTRDDYVVEIGSGKSTQIREFIEMSAKLCNSHSTLNFGAIPAEKDFIEKSASQHSLPLTGWQPLVDLEEGVLNCLKSLR